MTNGRTAPTLEGLTASERGRAGRLVEEIAHLEGMIARAEGRKAAALASLAAIAHSEGARSANPDGIEHARRAMAAEIAAATRAHPAQAKNSLEDAELLVHDLPRTHAALQSGRVSARHARVVSDAGRRLDPRLRAEIDAQAVQLAASRTPGELARVVKKRAAEVASLSLRERHERERRRRFVSLTDLDEAMSRLVLHLPTLEAHAIHDRATQLARIVRSDRAAVRDELRRECGHDADDECERAACACRDAAPEAIAAATDRRTFDQLRVDIMTDVLLTAEPSGHALHASGSGEALKHVRASVQVTVPSSMILDPDDGSAWVDDGALIAPGAARELAGRAAGWERLFHRADTGAIERVDHYRPSVAQRRALIGRDVTCRFPGCTTPARRADIDHTVAFAQGGATALTNLACLCEAHHVMKHRSDWRMRQKPGGVIEWTSPTGRRYEHEPASRVFFRDPSGSAPGSAPGIASGDRDGAGIRDLGPTADPPWSSPPDPGPPPRRTA